MSRSLEVRCVVFSDLETELTRRFVAGPKTLMSGIFCRSLNEVSPGFKV